MDKMLLLCLAWVTLFSADAQALQTSPRSLRIEDSKSGNIILGADSARIEAGEIFNKVIVLWGRLDVNGQASEVILLSGSIKFHPGSKVVKSLVVVGGEFEAASGADVGPDKIIFQTPGPIWKAVAALGDFWREHYEGTARVVSSVSICVVLWLTGLALFGLFPGVQRATTGKIHEWGQNIFAALAGMIFVPAICVVLIISIIGMLFLPFYFLFLGSFFLVSYLAAALWAGHRLLPPKKGSHINKLGFLLGLLACQLLWYSGVSWAYLPVLFLWAMGWGALLRSLRALWR